MVEEKQEKAPKSVKSSKLSKVKRKRWVTIVTPASFNSEFLGEIPVNEPTSLIGKAITINLMNLTRDIKKQNTTLKFIINDVQGDKATTELVGYTLVASSVRRLVRRGKERIDMSFICKTSDGKRVRIKPLMIPPVKLKSSVSALLKKTAINLVVPFVSKTTFDNVVRELIGGKLQRSLKDGLKKVYPIRVVDISAFYIENKVKKGKETVVEISEEPKEEEEVFEEEVEESKKTETDSEEPVQEKPKDVQEESSKEQSEEIEATEDFGEEEPVKKE
ncbi:MAG: hypothetical protein KKC75_00620 [Nanoarchaeota archaeon]|nr:hypothetical protein [Nanoarchaeota archaeon]MBU1005221.1 hypothetical protein [Nanoarchaeota archaeon]MBU1946892.1 hypothetical protein [Nanoarchaeota archaeon]